MGPICIMDDVRNFFFRKNCAQRNKIAYETFLQLKRSIALKLPQDFTVCMELFIENETYTRTMEKERLENKGLCLFHLWRIFESRLLFLSSASSIRLRLFGPISFFSHNLSYGTIELFSFQDIGMRFGESFFMFICIQH